MSFNAYRFHSPKDMNSVPYHEWLEHFDANSNEEFIVHNYIVRFLGDSTFGKFLFWTNQMKK